MYPGAPLRRFPVAQTLVCGVCPREAKACRTSEPVRRLGVGASNPTQPPSLILEVTPAKSALTQSAKLTPAESAVTIVSLQASWNQHLQKSSGGGGRIMLRSLRALARHAKRFWGYEAKPVAGNVALLRVNSQAGSARYSRFR
jgi:hypothetical protein